MYFISIATVTSFKIDIKSPNQEMMSASMKKTRTMDLFEMLSTRQVLSNLINNIFSPLGWTLVRFETGSLRLFVKCNSKDSLEKLWESISDGSLARQLEKVLLTDDIITGEDVTKMNVSVEADEQSYLMTRDKFCKRGMVCYKRNTGFIFGRGRFII